MKELWAVLSKEGLDSCYEDKQLAHDHANEMAGVFPECSPWRVSKYYLDPNECQCFDDSGLPLNECKDCPR